MTEVLRVEDLRVRYRTRLGDIRAVNGVNFALQESSIMCLVGESGSGKSTVALAMMGLLPHNGDVTEGKVLFQEQDLLRISFGRLRRIRGKDITMVFQEPQSALNPIQSIGDQLVEAIRTHTGSKKEQASRMAEESLREMGLPDPPQIMGRYPFQVSGGQAQRIMLAMALTLRPKVLVADEPTSSIDVTLQAEILARLKGYVQDWGCSILLITHDMGVVAHMADEVAVMYGGSIVEHADVRGPVPSPISPLHLGHLPSPAPHGRGRPNAPTPPRDPPYAVEPARPVPLRPPVPQGGKSLPRRDHASLGPSGGRAHSGVLQHGGPWPGRSWVALCIFALPIQIGSHTP